MGYQSSDGYMVEQEKRIKKLSVCVCDMCTVSPQGGDIVRILTMKVNCRMNADKDTAKHLLPVLILLPASINTNHARHPTDTTYLPAASQSASAAAATASDPSYTTTGTSTAQDHHATTDTHNRTHLTGTTATTGLL